MKEVSSLPVVQDPDDLIEGMAQYLSEIGADKAYIDEEEQKIRGNSTDPWSHMTKGLLNN